MILASFLYFWYPKMTSKYHTDFGNGVVVYADKYVNSGEWAYDCKTTRLISKQPLKFPISTLEELGKLDISTARQIGDEREEAKRVIKSVTAIKNWYTSLEYNYSSLTESSVINSHLYSLIAEHNGEEWVVFVSHGSDIGGQAQFTIRAKKYNPEEYVDHTKALSLAADSCGS